MQSLCVAVFPRYSNKHGVTADGLAPIEVMFDGSWHKQGNKSNFGVGAVIDVDLGLIWDYYVCSKLCNLCFVKSNALKKGKISEGDYIYWPEENHHDCEENLERSSGGMEPAAAVEL